MIPLTLGEGTMQTQNTDLWLGMLGLLKKGMLVHYSSGYMQSCLTGAAREARIPEVQLYDSVHNMFQVLSEATP